MITKEQLQTILDENNITFPESDLDNLDELFSELERQSLINFCLCLRSSKNGDDFWLQTEYFSPKLKKTIIWDYDAQSNFTDIDDLYTFIVNTNEELSLFEDNLIYNDFISDF